MDKQQLKPPLKAMGLKAKVSSLLFVSNKPLSTEKIASVCNSSADEIVETIEDLKNDLEIERYGFSLFQIGDSWQYRTAPDLKKTINKLIPARSKRLSKAAAETLAIVAYRQPVQKAEIEAIRGVDAIQTVKTLLDAKLVRIVGRDTTPGTPALYGTTDVFLEKFGLSDLSELPSVRELKELESEPAESEVFLKEADSEEE